MPQPVDRSDFSYVLHSVQELPLYCSGGLRFFWDNKFDHAMVAFLDCVQQFKEEVEKGDTGFCLPYRFDSHKSLLGYFIFINQGMFVVV